MAQVRIVGALRVECAGGVYAAANLGSRKGRVLLALLAADPDRLRPAHEIADVLWLDCAPRSAEATVSSLVSRLRREFGAELITGTRSGYRLGRPPHVTVDLERAVALVEQAEWRLSADQPALAVPAGTAALDLLNGTALADFADTDWVHAARARHAIVQQRARSAVGHACIAVGQFASATAVARAALGEDPLAEDAVRILMTALTALGEPAAALQVFDEFRTRLADELGSDPAPSTSVLHQRILRGDATPDVRTSHAARHTGALVGRESELAELVAAWSAAATGAGSLVLLTGVPGAGKTRLSDELAGIARDTGGTVLVARCYEAERALFLQPFVEAITGVVTRCAPADVVAAAGQHLDALARLVPAVGALVTQPPPEDTRAEIGRRRAVEAVVEFISALAHDRPLLLQLDDLHNAGESSIELLHFLRTVLPSGRLLVVTTVRTDEGAEIIATLAPVSTRIEVGPLAAHAVRRLAIDAGQGHRANEIVQRTGGHALFVAEILRGTDGVDAVPATLQAAVLGRTSRVGGSAEAVLRAGAVLGATFEPRHAAALAGVPPTQALADCERALQVGLLRTAGRSYEFANDLIREVLYASIPSPTRLTQHERALELLTGAPEQIATHASAIEDWPRASRAWLVAAEDALRSFAAADGVVLAGHALNAAQRVDDLELSGRALVLRGRARDAQADYAGAWADLTGAVDTARAAGDRRLEMIALREVAGNVPVALGHPPAAAEEQLRQCLLLAEQLGARITEVDTLGRLTVLAITRLDFVAALRWSEQAMRTAAATADDTAMELALDTQKSCWAYLGEIERLDAVVKQLEPLNRRHGSLYLLQWTLFEAAFVPLARSDYRAAAERIEAALAVCRRSGYVPFEAFYLAHLAWVYRLAGDTAAALATGADAVAMAQEHYHAWWLTTAAALHAGTLLSCGRNDEAASLLTEVRPAADVAGAQAYLARCLGPLALATGSLETLEQADRLLGSITAPEGSAWLAGADTYLSVARAWTVHGEPERARAALARFVPAARRVGWDDLVRAAEAALTH